MGTRAPIVQLACVQFNLAGDPLAQFNRRIALGEWFKHFEPDLLTIEWWLRQTEAARTAAFGETDRVALPEALQEFSDWVKVYTLSDTMKFWSHATFDPPNLVNAYQEVGITVPVSRRDFVDIRTIELLAPEAARSSPPRENFGEPHDALADCRYQAAKIAACMRELGKDYYGS